MVRSLHVNAAEHIAHVVGVGRHDDVHVLQQRLAGWYAAVERKSTESG